MLLYPKLRVYEFDVDFELSDEIKQHLIQTHLNTDYEKFNGLNFEIENHEEHFTFLYDVFYNTAQRIFGSLTLTPKNQKKCWAYVSNQSSKTNIHNHINTSVINCVYYANIPDSSACNLNFYKDSKLIVSHRPREKTLVIFPGFLDHCPEMGSDERYRISINMEMCCHEDVWCGM